MMLDLPAQPAFLDHAITNGPEHFRPILIALRDKGCALAIIPQGKRPIALPRDRGPVIAIVGDDLHQALGPAGFHRPSLRRALAGSVALVIVSSGPEAAPYALAATSAAGLCPLGLGWNGVLIETRPEREREWLAFAEKHRPDLHVVLCRPYPEVGQWLPFSTTP
jgi:hypothetical protein